MARGLVDDDADALAIYTENGSGVGVATLDEAAQAVAQPGLDLAEILAVVGVNAYPVMLYDQGHRVARRDQSQGQAAGGVAQYGGGRLPALPDEQLGCARGPAGVAGGGVVAAAHLLQASAVPAGDVVVGRDAANAIQNVAGLFVAAQLDQSLGQPVHGLHVVGKQLQYGAVHLDCPLPLTIKRQANRLAIQVFPEFRSPGSGGNFRTHRVPSIIAAPD